MIIEVTTELYTHIRKTKNRIFVEYQNCNFYDDLKHVRFGPGTKKSRNEIMYVRCPGKHLLQH